MLRFLFIIVIVQQRKDYINMGGQWLLWHSRHIDAVMRMLKSFTPPRSLCAVRMWPRKLKVIRMKGGNRGLMKSPRKVSILSVSSETNRKSILGKDSSERNLLGCTEKSAGKIKESCEDSHWTLQVQGLNCAAAAMSLKLKHNIEGYLSTRATFLMAPYIPEEKQRLETEKLCSVLPTAFPCLCVKQTFWKDCLSLQISDSFTTHKHELSVFMLK